MDNSGLELAKVMENLEQKLMEYESTIQTMTTIIFCFLSQNGNRFMIQKDVVEAIVNNPDINKYEFEFKVDDDGNGELILITPDEIEGKKKIQALHKTVGQ